MTELRAWVQGELLPASEATIPVHDRGFRNGEGVFETIRAYGDHPFRLDAHVRRAVAGAQELGFVLDAGQLASALRRTATANLPAFDGADSVLRLTASAGSIDPDSTFPGAPLGDATVVVTSHRLTATESAEENGVSARTVALTRELPHVKSTSYLAARTASRRAHELGAEEALLTAPDGRVLEGATSNLFAVIGGRIVTPPGHAGLLEGVTRAVVLEIAAARDLVTERRPLELAELLSADEAFLTASVREISALVEVDGAVIGDGRPGPLTGAIHADYRAVVARERGSTGRS